MVCTPFPFIKHSTLQEGISPMKLPWIQVDFIFDDIAELTTKRKNKLQKHSVDSTAWGIPTVSE